MDKTNLRAEMVIGLASADGKLIASIRESLGYGSVTEVRYSKGNTARKKAEARGAPIPTVARYSIRSKIILKKDLLN